MLLSVPQAILIQLACKIMNFMSLEICRHNLEAHFSGAQALDRAFTRGQLR